MKTLKMMKKLEGYYLIDLDPKKLVAFGKIFDTAIDTADQDTNLTSEFSEFITNPKVVALYDFKEPRVELDKFSIFWKEFDKQRVLKAWKEFDQFDRLKHLISHRTTETSLSNFIELILTGKRLKKTVDDNFIEILKQDLSVIANLIQFDSIRRSEKPISDNNLIDIIQHNHLLMISYKHYKKVFGKTTNDETKANIKLSEAIKFLNRKDSDTTFEQLKGLTPPIHLDFSSKNLKSKFGIEVNSQQAYKALLNTIKKFLNNDSYFQEQNGEPKISEAKFVHQWIDRLRLFTSYRQIKHSETGQFSKLQTAIICPIFLHFNIGGFPTQYATEKTRKTTKSTKQYWEVLKGRLDTFA